MKLLACVAVVFVVACGKSSTSPAPSTTTGHRASAQERLDAVIEAQSIFGDTRTGKMMDHGWVGVFSSGNRLTTVKIVFAEGWYFAECGMDTKFDPHTREIPQPLTMIDSFKNEKVAAATSPWLRRAEYTENDMDPRHEGKLTTDYKCVLKGTTGTEEKTGTFAFDWPP